MIIIKNDPVLFWFRQFISMDAKDFKKLLDISYILPMSAIIALNAIEALSED